MSGLLYGGLALSAIAAGVSEYVQADNSGQNSVIRAALSTAVQSLPLPGDVNIYRNTGNLPTEAQVQAWMRKVGRPASLRNSIRIVQRVRTSPYPGSDNVAQGMDEFALIAGRVTGTGIPGGQCLAVLCSVETGAGNPYNGNVGMNASLYNNNPGNTKLYRQGAATLNPTPDVYFLVDRHPSLDMYESHSTLETGFASWSTRTFGNDRYNTHEEVVNGRKTGRRLPGGPNGEPGCLDAMRAGDLEAFCAALGRGDYAASYRTHYKSGPLRGRMTPLAYRRTNGWIVSRYMNGRAQVLTRTGSHARAPGRKSLSTSQMRIERP